MRRENSFNVKICQLFGVLIITSYVGGCRLSIADRLTAFRLVIHHIAAKGLPLGDIKFLGLSIFHFHRCKRY